MPVNIATVEPPELDAMTVVIKILITLKRASFPTTGCPERLGNELGEQG